MLRLDPIARRALAVVSVLLAPLLVPDSTVRRALAQDANRTLEKISDYLPGETDGAPAGSQVSILFFLGEPPLLGFASPTVRAFRMSYFSALPVHGAAYRLTINADGSGQVASVFSSDMHNFKRNTVDVSKTEVDEFSELVNRAGFWEALSTEQNPNPRVYVNDGSYWMMEGVQNGALHYVYRPNPEPTPVTEIGCYLAADLAKTEDRFRIPACPRPAIPRSPVVFHETVHYSAAIKRISGHVVGYGNVNPGVQVEVFDNPKVCDDQSLSFNEKRKRQKLIATTSTDAKGRFDTRKIPRGTYEIQFSRDGGGWNILSVMVNVDSNGSRDKLCVNLSIEDAGPPSFAEACHRRVESR